MDFETPTPQGREEKATPINLDFEKTGVRETTHQRLLALSLRIPKSPIEEIRDQAKDLHTKSVSTRIELAKSFYLSGAPEVVAHLARDKDYRVREALAQSAFTLANPKFTKEATQLIHDENESVRLAMADNLIYSWNYRNELALQYVEETSERIKKKIEERLHVMISVYRQISELIGSDFESSDPQTRIEASENMVMVLSLPNEATRLFRDPNESVRIHIAQGRMVRMFPEQARILENDPSQAVREAYLQNPSRKR